MKGERGDFYYIGWGGGIILFAGLFDMMDGQVARIGKMSSTFGALYDSVLDRYSELTVFFGICFYLINQGYVISSIVAFIALIGSLMVSYVRARAEGLGLECKVGFMQRPERVVLTGLGALCCRYLCTHDGKQRDIRTDHDIRHSFADRCDILQHHGIRTPESLS